MLNLGPSIEMVYKLKGIKNDKIVYLKGQLVVPGKMVENKQKFHKQKKSNDKLRKQLFELTL